MFKPSKPSQLARLYQGERKGRNTREEHHQMIVKCLSISHCSRPREERPRKRSREVGMPSGEERWPSEWSSTFLMWQEAMFRREGRSSVRRGQGLSTGEMAGGGGTLCRGKSLFRLQLSGVPYLRVRSPSSGPTLDAKKLASHPTYSISLYVTCPLGNTFLGCCCCFPP